LAVPGQLSKSIFEYLLNILIDKFAEHFVEHSLVEILVKLHLLILPITRLDLPVPSDKLKHLLAQLWHFLSQTEEDMRGDDLEVGSFEQSSIPVQFLEKGDEDVVSAEDADDSLGVVED
jgi:hypothetical protein